MPGAVETAARAAADAKDAKKNTVKNLRDAVARNEGEFARALPEHIKPDRFIRAALTAINVVPKLGECTSQSVLAGLMQAAQLGLEISDVRGQAYLIPRKDNRDGGLMKASFQLGYRGMIDLAARSGITVDAEELRENDSYDFQLGTRRYLMHRPTIKGSRGEAIAYYATATFSDHRDPAFVIMGRDEIESHRDRFASTRSGKGDVVGPWVEHFDAMARKTVIRALLNYLPVSVELRDVIHREAIETTATETVDYGVRLDLPVAGDSVDPMDAVDTTSSEEAPAS